MSLAFMFRGIQRTTLLSLWFLILRSALLAETPGPVQLRITGGGSAGIAQGLGLQLHAQKFFLRGPAQPLDVTTQVQWSSADANIASVSNTAGSQGLLTAVSAGITTISAFSGPWHASLSITVTPPVLLSISLTPLNANIPMAQTTQFIATGHFSNGDAPLAPDWSSSLTGIATIDASGTSTGIAPGTTTITALDAASGISGSAVLNVGLNSISVTPTSATVPLGVQQQFTATGTFQGGGVADVTQAVLWNSSLTSVAAISFSGLATTTAQGMTTVSASSGSVSSNPASLTVGPPVVSSLAVSPAVATVLVGGSQQFIALATLTDGSQSDVTNLTSWSSSDTSVATIAAATGLAAGVNVGSSTITAAYASFSAQAQLNVRTGSRFAFALNSDETISGFTFDEVKGLLRHNGYAYLGNVQGSIALLSDPAGRFLYAANSGSNNVSALAVDALTGDLKPTPNSPFPAGAGPAALAVDPSGTYLYVANKASANPGVISGYSIQSNGDLTPLPLPSFASGNDPAALAVHPSGQFLYCANSGANTISVYTIANGELTPLAGSPFAAGGNSPQSLAIDSSGKFLLTANTAGNSVSVFSISGNGSLSAVAGSPFATGNHPVSLSFDFSGAHVFVADQSDGTISAFALNPNTGFLAPLAGSPFAASGTPSALAADGEGLYLFAANAAFNEIALFSVDAASGALSPLPSIHVRTGPVALALTPGLPPKHVPAFAEVAAPVAGGGLTSLAIDPATGTLSLAAFAVTGSSGSYAVTTDLRGRFVYSVDHLNAGNVYGFTLDPTFGVLSPVNGSPFPAAKFPSSPGVESSSRFLYALNLNSSSISGYSLAPVTGVLSDLPGSPFVDGNGPTAAALDPAGRFLYSANFFGSPQDGVLTFNIDPASGRLTAGPLAVILRPTALAIHPGGKFAYVVNGNGVNRVLAFNVDPATGGLCCAKVSLPVGLNPLAMAIDPDGRFLYVAGHDNSTVTPFKIDAATGALSQIASAYTSCFGPFDLKVDASGHFLYVACREGSALSIFNIDSVTGALSARRDVVLTMAPTGIALTEKLQ